MIYLDHAATTLPKPPEVIAAVSAAMAEAGNPSRGGHRFAGHAEEILARARLRVARLLGAADPRRVVFTLNGTDALNIAIHAVVEHAARQTGRTPHVVTTVLEHNSVTRPLETLRAQGRVELDRVEASAEGVLDPGRIGAVIRSATALVAVTMASNALGTLQPVSEIAGEVRRRSDALLLVDASQAVGAIEIDLERLGADLLAAPGHKALLGPTGTGILYVGPGAFPELDGRGARIGVFRSGGTGGDSRLTTMPPELPHRLEGGTPNVAGIAGLAAGVEWVERRGVAAIRSHERGLIERAIAGLAGRRGVRLVGPAGAERRCGALSMTVEGIDPLDAAAILDSSYGIAARAGLHCAPGAHRAVGTFPAGTLRMSVAPFTTAEEVDAFVNAVGEFAG